MKAPAGPLNLANFKTPAPAGPAPQTPAQTAANPFGGASPTLAGAAKAVSSVLPVGNLGKAVGDSAEALYQGVKTRSMAPIKEQATENNANMGKVVGDTVGSIATPAMMALGGGETVLGRAAAQAGLGGALGGSTALSAGKTDPGTVGASTLKGSVLGAGLSIGGDALSAFTSAMPDRIVQGALPKLKPGTAGYALKNTPLGTLSTMLKESNTTRSTLQDSVQTILKGDKYATAVGNGAKSMEDTLASFGNSELENTKDVASAVKEVVPGQAKLVDKVANGTATLAEKNTLRSAIDQNTYKQFGDMPKLTFNKQVASTLANNLRTEVQSAAPETKPVFQKLSQEINLNKALGVAKTKADSSSGKIGLLDLVSAYAGIASHGISGALGSVVGERAARSPAVAVGVAKGIKAATPVLGQLARAARVPLISAASQPQ